MWKPIKDYENSYEISDDGYVKSLLTNRILKPCNAGKGYLRVCLRKDGITKSFYIHQLVAFHFVDNTNGNPIVNHIDGDKHNNNSTNLEWVTYSENNKHAYDTNLKLKGEKFYNAKLTQIQVDEIRRLGKYTTFQNIADKYGVSRATIRDVLINRTW